MFSYTGLSPEQVRLREQHSVYMVSSAGPTSPG
jgi:aspartate/tyrosine/aromatic aminotransferase